MQQHCKWQSWDLGSTLSAKQAFQWSSQKVVPKASLTMQWWHQQRQKVLRDQFLRFHVVWWCETCGKQRRHWAGGEKTLPLANKEVWGHMAHHNLKTKELLLRLGKADGRKEDNVWEKEQGEGRWQQCCQQATLNASMKRVAPEEVGSIRPCRE